jgi:hypothetical protein
MIASCIARRVVLKVGTKDIFPNLYSLIVAPSTRFRKSTAFDIANQTLDRAGLRRLTLPARMSPESLLQELTGRSPGDFGQWEKVDQDEWQDERVFAAQRAWLMEEAATLLESFDQKHSAALLPIVLDLYDCPGARSVSTIGRGRQTVRRAYLTICGPTTPAALKTHLANSSYWGNGLWARFIFVTPDHHPEWKFWDTTTKDIPNALTQSLKTLALEKLPMPKQEIMSEAKPLEPITISLAKGVWEHWESYAKSLEFEMIEKIPARFHASYGRFATFAIKVAMLLSTVDWAESNRKTPITIGLTHWARAQMITELWRANLHRLAELPNRDGDEDDLETKIMRRLSNDQPMTAREISRALNMTAKNERDAIDLMLPRMKRDGLIDERKRKGERGREVQGWVKL